jgi:hypothetical protein
MSQRLFALVIVFALLFSGDVTPVAAQTTPVVAGAGISFLNFQEGTGNGFVVDIAGDIAGSRGAALGLVGELEWHRQDEVDALSFAGGARLTGRVGTRRVQPFGQFIIGRMRFSGAGESDTATLFAPGGGVMVGLGEPLMALAKVDVAIVRFEGGDGETGQRYTFGIAYQWGTP